VSRLSRASVKVERVSRPSRAAVPREPEPVTLISDATGALGEHVLQAIFTQFPPQSFRLTILPFVNSDDALRTCLARLRHLDGVVVHATIYDTFKRRIEAACRKRGLPVYDLTDPIMMFLRRASGRRPQLDYRQLHALSPDYFKRVDAIEYTINHDDGAGLRTLSQADIVLTGVSRTTKTPTSMVLAMHGYRVANVPLVARIDPPQELVTLPAARVVCLMLDAAPLTAIRAARAQERLRFDGRYADASAVQDELAWARALGESHGWWILDVTDRSVEETAARIIDLVVSRTRRPA